MLAFPRPVMVNGQSIPQPSLRHGWKAVIPPATQIELLRRMIRIRIIIYFPFLSLDPETAASLLGQRQEQEPGSGPRQEAQEMGCGKWTQPGFLEKLFEGNDQFPMANHQ